MDIAILAIVGFGFITVVISLMIMMFVLFNYGQTQSKMKTTVEQTFLQSQINSARLMGMERSILYIHDVVKREEQAQAMLNQVKSSGTGPLTYATEDGSLTADSLPGLLDKMNKDSRYNPDAKDTPETPRTEMDFLDGLFDRPHDEDDEDGA